MRHRKTGGILSVKVYCPKAGEERKFSFNPTDFCPVCNKPVTWSSTR